MSKCVRKQVPGVKPCETPLPKERSGEVFLLDWRVGKESQSYYVYNELSMGPGSFQSLVDRLPPLPLYFQRLALPLFLSRGCHSECSSCVSVLFQTLRSKLSLPLDVRYNDPEVLSPGPRLLSLYLLGARLTIVKTHYRITHTHI
jgi:hypothetical protein